MLRDSHVTDRSLFQIPLRGTAEPLTWSQLTGKKKHFQFILYNLVKVALRCLITPQSCGIYLYLLCEKQWNWNSSESARLHPKGEFSDEVQGVFISTQVEGAKQFREVKGKRKVWIWRLSGERLGFAQYGMECWDTSDMWCEEAKRLRGRWIGGGLALPGPSLSLRH